MVKFAIENVDNGRKKKTKCKNQSSKKLTVVSPKYTHKYYQVESKEQS